MINIAVYVVSSMPTLGGQREIVAVLPCGAVLAARACVPGHIVGAWRSWVAIAAAAVVALVPLAGAATRPPATPAAARLASWLEARGLTYGIGGYWDASAVTVQSGDRVQVRAIALKYGAGPVRLAAYDWETNASWYDASLHDATFVIADRPHSYPNDDFTVAVFEKYLHRPAAIYQCRRPRNPGLPDERAQACRAGPAPEQHLGLARQWPFVARYGRERTTIISPDTTRSEPAQVSKLARSCRMTTLAVRIAI